MIKLSTRPTAYKYLGIRSYLMGGYDGQTCRGIVTVQVTDDQASRVNSNTDDAQ